MCIRDRSCRLYFTSWGQKLVNTLRALHDVKYNLQDNEEEEENNEEGFYEPSEDDSCCEEGGCHCPVSYTHLRSQYKWRNSKFCT